MVKNNKLETVGEFLKQLRKGKNKTMVRIARDAGVSRPMLYYWESDQNLPSVYRVGDVARGYEMTKEEEGKFLNLMDGSKLSIRRPPTATQIFEYIKRLPKKERQKLIEAVAAYDAL